MDIKHHEVTQDQWWDDMEAGEKPDIVRMKEEDLREKEWIGYGIVDPLVGSRRLESIPMHQGDAERLNRVEVANYIDDSLD